MPASAGVMPELKTGSARLIARRFFGMKETGAWLPFFICALSSRHGLSGETKSTVRRARHLLHRRCADRHRLPGGRRKAAARHQYFRENRMRTVAALPGKPGRQVFRAARIERYLAPEKSLADHAGHSVRTDAQLWRIGHRTEVLRAGRRPSLRRKPDPH